MLNTCCLLSVYWRHDSYVVLEADGENLGLSLFSTSVETLLYLIGQRLNLDDQ